MFYKDISQQFEGIFTNSVSILSYFQHTLLSRATTSVYGSLAISEDDLLTLNFFGTILPPL